MSWYAGYLTESCTIAGGAATSCRWTVAARVGSGGLYVQQGILETEGVVARGDAITVGGVSKGSAQDVKQMRGIGGEVLYRVICGSV